MPSLLPLPSPQTLLSSPWPSKLLSLPQRFQKGLARLVIKIRELREIKTRIRAGRNCLPQKPKMLLRMLQLRQRKQRLRLKRLILRLRMLLPLNQARRKTLLLLSPRLSSQDFSCRIFFFFFFFFCSGTLLLDIMYSSLFNENALLFISCSFALDALKFIIIIYSTEHEFHPSKWSERPDIAQDLFNNYKVAIYC